MDTLLWQDVLGFNLDDAVGEYNFSARLENENCWTTNFAATAIVEYKKFMFLTAVSDEMVSPSAIVDVVWHQHLIFSQSYTNFCGLLGKKIDHIPSTHSPAEADRFKRAEERTKRLYRQYFGEAQVAIWGSADIYASLNMERSKYTIEKMIGIGAGVLLPLLVAAYFVLRPWYVTIDSPDFIGSYIFIAAVCFIGQWIYNRSALKKMIGQWPQDSFVFDLTALELVYLKTNLKQVINGILNNLLINENIAIGPRGNFSVQDISKIDDPVQLCAAGAINVNPEINYPTLLNLLASKPTFNKTARVMDALKNYIRGSRWFIKIFAINLTVLYTLVLAGTVRLILGVQRDKPVTFIIEVMVALVILSVIFCLRLTQAIGALMIPRFYIDNIVGDDERYSAWDWQYFMLGTAVFTSTFAPLTNPQGGSGWSFDNNNSGSSCGSNCGSSDNSGGSSCGSSDSGGGPSCGGCGSN